MPSNKNTPEYAAKWGWMVRNRMRVMWWSIALLVAASLLFGWQPGGLRLPGWRSIAALALLFCGLGLRSWAAGVIHKDSQLATTGPYALSRHPLYAGSALAVVGLGLVASAGFGLVALAFAALVYLPTLKNEEMVLCDKFPEAYPRYRQHTAFLGPKTRPNLWASWSAGQWLANDEHELLAVVAVLVGALELWSRF